MSSIPPSSAVAIAGGAHIRPTSGAPSNSYPLSSSFRRRLGRAASPPTWTWYEHITPQHDDDDGDGSSDAGSGSGSGSDDDDDEDEDEDEEEHQQAATGDAGEEGAFEMEIDIPAQQNPPQQDTAVKEPEQTPAPPSNAMDVDRPSTPPPPPATPPTPAAPTAPSSASSCDSPAPPPARPLSDVAKGKQPAPAPPSPAISRKSHSSSSSRSRAARHSEPAYRPILTIHRSHGFVWNQDLFVPAYIKDRYVTSTSPPIHGDSCLNSFTSSPAANGNAGGAPFDPVDVVEIKVTGDELDGWIS